MDESSNKTSLIWYSVCGLLLLFAVASTVFSVIATKKNNENQDEISNLKTQIAEKDAKIAQLNREATIRRKMETPETTEDSKTQPVEEVGDEEMAAWNELYNSTIVSYSNAIEYIYMPQIGKKLKVSNEFTNVKYSYDRYGITVWATLKGTEDKYDFSKPDKNPNGIGTFSIYGENYRTKWTKITNQLFTDTYGHGEEFILESNRSHLTFSYAPVSCADEETDCTAVEAEQAVASAFHEYVMDVANYEDM